MHTTEVHDFGIRVTFSGTVKPADARQFQQEFTELLDQFDEDFGLLLDRRKVTGIAPQAVDAFALIERTFSTPQLRRIAIVIDGSQFPPQLDLQRLSPDVRQKARYVDVQETENWKREALQWIQEGSEPEASVMG